MALCDTITVQKHSMSPPCLGPERGQSPPPARRQTVTESASCVDIATATAKHLGTAMRLGEPSGAVCFNFEAELFIVQGYGAPSLHSGPRERPSGIKQDRAPTLAVGFATVQSSRNQGAQCSPIHNYRFGLLLYRCKSASAPRHAADIHCSVLRDAA